MTPAARSFSTSPASKPCSDRMRSLSAPGSGAERPSVAGRPAEPYRRRHLVVAVSVDEAVPVRVVRVGRRLHHAENGRDARVPRREGVLPLATGLRPEDLLEHDLELRPLRLVVLRCDERGVETEPVDQIGVELVLDRADRHVAAVEGLVAPVERRAALRLVRAPLVDPVVRVAHGVEERHQRERAVGHGRLDHLTAPAAVSLVQRREHTHRQHHRPAAEVAHEVQRHGWWRALRSHRLERAGDRDVVEVVAALLGQRS